MIVKTCACKREYGREAFLALAMPRKGGRQADGAGGFLALRQCSNCGSTLAVPFDTLKPPAPNIPREEG